MESISAGLPLSYATEFEFLHDLHSGLIVRLRTYQALYAVSEEQTGVLNRCAPAFFGLVQQIMLDVMISNVCKLTDQGTTGSRTNLVVDTLARHLHRHEEVQLLGKLQPVLDELTIAVSPLRAHRNKRISHTDYGTAIDSTGQSLPRIRLANIQAVIDLISKFLHVFQKHFTGNHIEYGETILALGGADSIVSIVTKRAHEKDRKTKEIQLETSIP